MLFYIQQLQDEKSILENNLQRTIRSAQNEFKRQIQASKSELLGTIRSQKDDLQLSITSNKNEVFSKIGSEKLELQDQILANKSELLIAINEGAVRTPNVTFRANGVNGIGDPG